jgi:DNA-binding transcriptional MerR regulator
MGLEQLDLFASFGNETPAEKKEIFSNAQIKVKIKTKKKPVEPVAAIIEPEKTKAIEPAFIPFIATPQQIEADPAPVEEKKIISIATPNGSKRGRKSYKEIYTNVDLINIPDEEILEQKLYYSISEVAGWFNVTTSQIRFWENEFDILQPRKNRKGDRLFRVEDIKNLQLIYYLVRNRKFSLEGAKDYIKANKNKALLQHQLVESLTKFRSFLLELKANLAS